MKVLALLLPVVMSGAQGTLSLEMSSGNNPSQLVVSGYTPGSHLEFFDQTVPLGAVSVELSGRAAFPLTGLTPGSHTISASERGTGLSAGEPLRVTLPAVSASQFSAASGFALGIQPGAFAAGDLFHNGAASFVAAGEGTVSVLSISATSSSQPYIFTGIAQPTAVLIADFNGDGWNDVAIASASGHIAILLNNARGGLAAPRFYNAGSHPSALAISDFNGDGIPDLAVANEGGDDVSLLAGRSDGTFDAAVHFAAGLAPRSIASADLNGDGFADLAVADFAGNEITILLGDGTGTFRAASPVATGNGPALVFAGDFNEDGAVDLAVLNQLDQTVDVLYGDGSGNYRLSSLSNNVVSFAAGHILGSSHLDFVMQSGSELRILAGAGNGAFSNDILLQSSAAPQSLLLADFNGDGRLDLAAADLSGVLSVFTGSAVAVTSSSTAAGQVQTSPASATTAIVPRQHSNQIGGTTASSVTLSSSNTSSNLGQAVTFTAAVSPSAATGKVTFYNDAAAIVAVRPVSGGQAQLTTSLLPSGTNSLTARYSGDSTYASSLSPSVAQLVSVQPQSGFLTSTNPFAAGSTPYTVVAADFNNDGIVDLAVTDSGSTGVSVFLGVGNGTFGAGTSYGSGSQPWGLVAVDLDGDGNVDLAFTNGTGASVTVLTGTGTGSFSVLGSYPTGNTPESVAAADFNNDGITDLVVANWADGTVGILLGGFVNGKFTLQPQVTYNVGSNPTSVAVADFNGDENTDVVVTNNGNGSATSISVLFGNGDGTLQTAAFYAGGTQAISVFAADLNNDGKPDLAVANMLSSGANVTILLNSGTGTFPGTHASHAAGVNPRFVTVGDFNSDGIPDLAVIDKGGTNGNGAYNILLGTGGGAFGAATPTGLGTMAWSAVVADFTGAGRSELAVASSGSSTMYIVPANGLYPDLTVAVANAASFSQGQTGATYTITVTNSGVAGTSGIVSVTDTLPAGITATALSGSGWTCTLATLNCTTSVSLSAGDSYPVITVTVNVASNAPASLTDSVTVSGGGETNLSNDTATDVTTILQATTLSLTSSPNPSTVGSSVAVTATVSSTSATGMVVFFDEFTPLATVTVSSGQAVLNTKLLSSGTHTLSARYSGDTQYLSSAAHAIVQTVQNQLQNGFQSGVNYGLAGNSPSAIAVADFNNDGAPDVAVAASATGRVLLLLNNNNGTGTFPTTNPPFTAAGSAPAAIVAADFNGDGYMDAAVANNTLGGGVTILLNNQSGGFSSLTKDASAGSHSQYLVAADFNGDGIPDLAVANNLTGAGTVSILLGKGDGTFQSPLNNTVGSDPVSIVVADFSGDGIPDLAVANHGSNTVSVLFGNGDGTFQPAVTYNVGTGPQALARGDVNGDGFFDLVVANYGSNNVTVLLGASGGAFSATTSGPYAAGTNPNSIVESDFNGDGIPDLAVSDAGGGVSLLLGVGDGSFQSPQTYLAGTTPVSLALADFNGDGLSDLAVANQGSNNITLLLGGIFYTSLSISSSHVGNFTQGQTGAQYALTVTNVGQYPTAGLVTLTDTLPKGLTATAIAGQGWSCVLTSLSCTRSDALTPTSSYMPVMLTVNVSASAPAQVTNTANVSGGNENTVAPAATDPTTVIQNTTLSLTSSDPAWVYGESVTLTATVSASAATGSITFSQGSTTLGTVAVSNGAASIPGPALTPGAYNFTAVYSGDASYAGSTGTLAQNVGKATATVTLSNLAVTWTGGPQSATVATTPASLNVSVTYAGNPTPPSNVGTYAVVATVSDPNYMGSATGSLVISPIQATVNLTIPTATWDGTPKTATATTTPSGLAVSITYGGSTTAPSAAGSYLVVATVTTPNYAGSASGTLLINAVPVTITLSGFNTSYNGTAQAVSAVTSPANIALTITYNGSTTLPVSAGSYAVSAAPASTNYSGSASGTLVIGQAAAAFTLGNLLVTYTGTTQPVSVSVMPSTVSYSVKYNGSINAPTIAGSYSVVVTANDPNYSGGTSGTLTIQKASPAITWAQPAAIAFGSALGAVQLNASTATPGSFAYTPAAGTVLTAGTGQTLSAVFTPTDTVDYNTMPASTTITVNPVAVQGVLIMVAKSLSRDANNNIVVSLTLSNGGTQNAASVVLTNVAIAGNAGSPLPVAFGTIPAGQTAQTTVTIPGSAGASGSVGVLAVGGTYASGSFNASSKTILP